VQDSFSRPAPPILGVSNRVSLIFMVTLAVALLLLTSSMKTNACARKMPNF
jgi:hypothetical protein